MMSARPGASSFILNHLGEKVSYIDAKPELLMRTVGHYYIGPDERSLSSLSAGGNH